MTSVGWKRSFDLRSSGERSGTAVDGPAGVGLSVRRGEGIFGTRFGRRPVADPAVRTGDDAGWRRTPDAVGPPVAGADETRGFGAVDAGSGLRCGRRTRKGARRGSFCDRVDTTLQPLLDDRLRSVPSSHSSRRASRRVRVSTRDRMSPRKDGIGRSRHGGGLNTSGSASTGLAAPGGLLATAAAAGSAGPSSVAGTDGGSGSGNAPGGRVTLIGPATFTGAPGSPAAPVGWCSERGWRGRGLAAVRHQSGRSRHVHRREHGELRGVVGHDTREPDRDLRSGRGIDHRRREQCHQHGRSGGERVDVMTTANCRLVASRLRQLSPSRNVPALTRSR